MFLSFGFRPKILRNSRFRRLPSFVCRPELATADSRPPGSLASTTITSNGSVVFAVAVCADFSCVGFRIAFSEQFSSVGRRFRFPTVSRGSRFRPFELLRRFEIAFWFARFANGCRSTRICFWCVSVDRFLFSLTAVEVFCSQCFWPDRLWSVSDFGWELLGAFSFNNGRKLL